MTVFDLIENNPEMVTEVKQRVNAICFGRSGFDSESVRSELMMQYFVGYRDALKDLRKQKIVDYGEFPG